MTGADVSPAMNDAGNRRRDEIVAFFLLAVVLVPTLASGLIGAYGLLVWMLE